MTQTQFEIIYSLGTQEKADTFIEQLQNDSTSATSVKVERQLDHYFAGGNVLDIHNKLSSHMPMISSESLYHLCLQGRNHLVRTRSILPGDTTKLVIQSPVDTDSQMSTKLLWEQEFENMTLEELDRILVDLGREYVSRGSSIKTQYKAQDIMIYVDQDAEGQYQAVAQTLLGMGEDVISARSRIQTLVGVLLGS